MSSDPLFMWGDIALLSGGPAIVLFVLFYGFGARWWSTLPGRAVFALALSLALVYGLLVAALLLGGDYPLRGWMRLVVFVSTSSAMWFLLIAYLRTRRGGRHR